MRKTNHVKKFDNLLLFTPALALLMLGVGGCGQSSESKVVVSAQRTVRADVLTVSTTAIPSTYAVTGSIKALLNTTLASKAMGRVVSIAVREGDLVRQGQEVVSIDNRELQAAVNVAQANLQASVVGEGSAKTSAVMEDRTTRAAIAQSESALMQSQAALAAAEARRDQVRAGLRKQEISQSHLVVSQAESTYKLARLELERTRILVAEGALAARELDLAQNRCDLAKGQFDIARESESMAKEGARSQEIRAAQEAVVQAGASVRQAKSALAQARAAAMTVALKRKEVEVAQAQVKQASAVDQSARVALSYSQILAPYPGRVVQRYVDPGALASFGTPLLGIEGGDYRLETVVPESILKSVKVGTTAKIQIDALGARDLTGQVVEIVPQGDPASHTFNVKFRLSTSTDVKSGMFGRAQIQTGMALRTLVPQEATWEKQGLHYIFVVNKQGIARLRMITWGDRIGDKVEILSGLNVGDKVISGHVTDVSDGDKIEASQS